MADQSTVAGRLVLLTLGTLVAVAPLCSTVIAAPEGSAATGIHGDHAMSPASHHAPAVKLTNVTLSGSHHGEHCAPHSCCAAALVKTARLKQADGTAVLALMAAAPTASQDSCSLASVAGPGATPEAAVAHVPLRL